MRWRTEHCRVLYHFVPLVYLSLEEVGRPPSMYTELLVHLFDPVSPHSPVLNAVPTDQSLDDW